MGQRVLDWLDAQPAAPAPPPVHLAGIPPENILGLAEAAQVVGKPTATLRTWINKGLYSFPEPVTRVASAGGIWDREQVDIWVMGNADLLGRIAGGR